MSNWWDEAKIDGAFDQIRELGLKAATAPTLKDAENNAVDYASQKMDIFWKALTRVGLLYACTPVSRPSSRGAARSRREP